jgi:hypothetical protein
MTRQLARSCPHCGEIMIVKVFEPQRYTALQAVNGRCVRCQDRLAWIVIRCNRRNRQTVEPPHKTAM